jgi:AmiR/NasT family two-component response regulator
VPTVAGLGHEVIAEAVEVAEVAALTARERPDVALVGLGASSERALGMIDQIVQKAVCPVILLLHAPDPGFVDEASKRGVFAVLSERAPEEWQGTLDIVLRRFAEYHELQGAFGRRSTIERAKGVLMGRHSVGEERAFTMLREHARDSNRKLVDVAAAVVDGHALLSSGQGSRAPGGTDALGGGEGRRPHPLFGILAWDEPSAMVDALVRLVG